MHRKRKYEPPMLVDINAFHIANARCDATGSAADPENNQYCTQGTSAGQAGFGNCSTGNGASGSSASECISGSAVIPGTPFGAFCQTGTGATIHG